MAAHLRLPVSVLVLDVDGTLTLRDTLEDLVHAAIEGAARRSRPLMHSAESAAAAEEQAQLKRERWLELKEAYSRPYAAFLQAMLKEEESVPSLNDSLKEEETVVSAHARIMFSSLLDIMAMMSLGCRSTTRCGEWKPLAFSRG